MHPGCIVPENAKIETIASGKKQKIGTKGIKLGRNLQISSAIFNKNNYPVFCALPRENLFPAQGDSFAGSGSLHVWFPGVCTCGSREYSNQPRRAGGNRDK